MAQKFLPGYRKWLDYEVSDDRTVNALIFLFSIISQARCQRSWYLWGVFLFILKNMK